MSISLSKAQQSRNEKNKDALPLQTAKIETAVRMILEAVGEDVGRDGLRDTPARVARMYQEVFSGLRSNPSEVLSAKFEVETNELVLVKDIPFYSMCEHHLLPFFGVAHIAYLPSKGIVTGLSKLARLVDAIAKRPQVQERLTNEVAELLHTELETSGVLVVVEAEHLCMNMRGIRKPGSKTLTIASRGVYADQEKKREEALSLIRQP